MSAELIKVDFKSRTVQERVNLAEPAPEWRAAKDPNFKAFIEGMVHVAQNMHQDGYDWRRMVVVSQDNDACVILWDQSVWGKEEVSDALMMACSKVDHEQGDEGEPT